MRILNANNNELVINNPQHWTVYNHRNQNKTSNVNIRFSDKLIESKWEWQTVIKEVFEKDQLATMKSIALVLEDFYEWMDTVNYNEDDINTFNEIDYGLFLTYLEKTRKIAEETRRNKFSFLKKAFDELSLLNADFDYMNSTYVAEVSRYNFKNAVKKAISRNSKKVLAMEHLEEIQLALLRDFQQAKKELHLKKEERTVDMVVFISIWLGMKHGIRPTELLNLTFNNIHYDDLNKNHRIECKGSKSKPDRTIYINQQTADVLKFYTDWVKGVMTVSKHDSFLYFFDAVKPKPLQNYNLVEKMRVFKKKHYLFENSDYELEFNLTNLRRSYGALIASQTTNKEVLRQIMGHHNIQTTERHYTAINRKDLSTHVSNGLKFFVLELATTYREPLRDINEDKEVAAMVKAEPDRDYRFGICTTPKTESTLKKSCKRASNCLECDFLIPETRKLQNYILERDFWLNNLQNINDDRVRQQRILRINMLEAYIYLIEDKLKTQPTKVEVVPKQKIKRKSYKKKG